MGADSKSTQAQLTTLAGHLSQAPESILDAWRAQAESDVTLAPCAHLTRAQFINDIPRIVEALCNRLRSWPADDTPAQRQFELEAVRSHSQHRWRMGYNMRALVRDWGHLNLCMLQELDRYGGHDADAEKAALPAARQVWARLVNDSIAQSAVEYHDLLQVEAVARLNQLEIMLAHMHEMELLRGNSLRTATHDLRGGLGILMGTASLIGDEEMSQAERARMCAILTRGVTSLHQMLEELMDMARLEAAQDPRRTAPFDVGETLAELCLDAQPMAAARGLCLKTEGPDHLTVEGDLVKTRRIAQNLLLNALKYTKAGGVFVTWGAHGGAQWLLRVRDSGPGLEQGPSALPGEPHGEGVGLSIVKRLCEVLDAEIAVESKAGLGTTFQVAFPLHYRRKAER